MRWPWLKQGADAQARVRGQVQAAAVRLAGDLFTTSGEDTVLVTSVHSDAAAALVAECLADAVRHLDGQSPLLCDLRGPVGEAATIVAMPDRPTVEMMVPPRDAGGNRKRTLELLAANARLYQRRIYLCGPVLDPASPMQDPLAWGPLGSRVIVVCSEGIVSDDEMRQAAERLRRGGFTIVGGVLVAGQQRPGATGAGRPLRALASLKAAGGAA